MKVALVLPSNIESLPYVQYYIDLFDKKKIEYDIIAWNRLYKSDYLHSENYFNLKSLVTNSALRKFIDYFLFSRFVINKIENHKYDYVVIFTIANALFLYKYIKKKYCDKFIFDIRDYSPLIKFFRPIINDLLKRSSLNCISSKGFEIWLPPGKYVISHNVRKSLLKKKYPIKPIDKKRVQVLTIGTLRDFKANSQLILDLGNNIHFDICFAGDGPEKSNLADFAQKMNILNVSFSGYYNKKDEPLIIYNSDFINILVNKDIIGNYLMSNRFYLALMHRKPMLVYANTYQAKYVKEYNLGVIIGTNDNIAQKINEYIDSFDYKKFDEGCESCLREIERDEMVFENMIMDVLLLSK